jgi:hypothetical protein
MYLINIQHSIQTPNKKQKCLISLSRENVKNQFFNESQMLDNSIKINFFNKNFSNNKNSFELSLNENANFSCFANEKTNTKVTNIVKNEYSEVSNQVSFIVKSEKIQNIKTLLLRMS